MTRSRRASCLPLLAALVLLPLLSLPLQAHAQPQSKTKAPLRGIETLAEQVAIQAAEAGAEAPVGVHARGESPELARAFVTLVSAELARRGLPAVPVEAVDSVRAEAEARARGHRSLLRIQLGLESGLLHARGDLLGTWVNFWSGAQPTRPPSPAAGLEASVDADAHALALAAAPLPVPATPSLAPQTGEVRLVQATFARLPKHTAALTAGDLDGDGRDEVVVLTDEEVLVFAPDGKLLARRELRHQPASPSPSREPFGSVVILPAPARVVWSSAQKARGEALTLEPNRGGLRVVAQVEDSPVARTGSTPLVAKLNPGRNTWMPALSRDGTPALSLPQAFTTLGAFATTAEEGTTGTTGAPTTDTTDTAAASATAAPIRTELLAVFPNGGAQWRSDTGDTARTLELKGLGAGSALVDVDGDGYPELATSEAVFAPQPEVLRVLKAPSLGMPLPGEATSAEAVRFRKELPRGRILQIAGADLEGQKSQSLIVAVWLPDGSTELQLYRRAK